MSHLNEPNSAIDLKFVDSTQEQHVDRILQFLAWCVSCSTQHLLPNFQYSTQLFANMLNFRTPLQLNNLQVLVRCHSVNERTHTMHSLVLHGEKIIRLSLFNGHKSILICRLKSVISKKSQFTRF